MGKRAGRLIGVAGRDFGLLPNWDLMPTVSDAETDAAAQFFSTPYEGIYIAPAPGWGMADYIAWLEAEIQRALWAAVYGPAWVREDCFGD